MLITFNSELIESLNYDIYIDNVHVHSICLSQNERSKTIDLKIEKPDFELSVIPSKSCIKNNIYNLLKQIIFLPFTIFLFWITWESIFISYENFYDIKSKKTIKIKNQNNGTIKFNFTRGRINSLEKIYSIKINILYFDNLEITAQSSNLTNDIKNLCNKFYEWIIFYFLLFLPAYILLIFLSFIATANVYYTLIVISVLFVFLIIHTLLNLRCFKIFKLYKKQILNIIK